MHQQRSAIWPIIAMIVATQGQAELNDEPNWFDTASVEAWLEVKSNQCELAQTPTAFTIEQWPSLYDYSPRLSPSEHRHNSLRLDTRSREPVKLRGVEDFTPYQSAAAFVAHSVQHTRVALSDPNLWPTYSIAEADKNWLDNTREYLHETAQEPVIWFDNFFAVKRGPSHASHDLRLTPKFDCSDIQGCDFSFSVRSRVTLPYTQERLRLLLTNEDPDTLFDSLDRRSVTPSQSERRNPISAALSWALRTTEDYNISISSGLQLRTPIRAFVQANTTGRLKLTDKAQVTGGQSVYYRSDEGAGARTQIDVDHSMADSRQDILRWRQRYDVNEETTGVDWHSSVEYLHQVDRDLAWGAGVASNGNIHTSALADGHRVWLRYRKRFYREWLFWELQPYVRWDREHGFDHDPGIELSLEIYLDEKP
ncbi:hypothetical protein FHS30_002867 [Simiduia aestuariiviva]|uniref:Uncharacterized protein n=2 Tax=Simiduia aestuariiviva TaxID=1510459 RepID=A0A839UNA1_9GAMM|nr:hypothetical protein [Simiduia aestuariiviva]